MGIDGEGGMEIDLTDRGSRKGGPGLRNIWNNIKSDFSTKAQSRFASIALTVSWDPLA